MVMQGELFQKICLISKCSVVDFLARLSLLLETKMDSEILEALYFMKLKELPQLKNLKFCFWKMSKIYYHTIQGKPLKQSYKPFQNWGIYVNGKYLTADILAYHTTEKEYLLSDILEKDVPDQYYLSPKALAYLERAKTRKRGHAVILPVLLPIIEKECTTKEKLI